MKWLFMTILVSSGWLQGLCCCSAPEQEPPACHTSAPSCHQPSQNEEPVLQQDCLCSSHDAFLKPTACTGNTLEKPSIPLIFSPPIYQANPISGAIRLQTQRLTDASALPPPPALAQLCRFLI